MTAYLKWSYGEPAYVFDSVVWNYGGPSLFIPATGVAHYTISCAAGSFSISGVASIASVQRKLQCNAGSYSISGVQASTKFARKLPCAAGSYSFSGISSGLKFSRIFPATPGAFVLTGIAASLIKTTGTANYTIRARSLLSGMMPCLHGPVTLLLTMVLKQ